MCAVNICRDDTVAAARGGIVEKELKPAPGKLKEQEPCFSLELNYQEPGAVLFLKGEEKKGLLWIGEDQRLHFSVYEGGFEGEKIDKLSTRGPLENGEWYEAALGVYRDKSILFLDWGREDVLGRQAIPYGKEVVLSNQPGLEVDSGKGNDGELTLFQGELRRFDFHYNYPPEAGKYGDGSLHDYPWGRVVLKSLVISFLFSLVIALFLLRIYARWVD